MAKNKLSTAATRRKFLGGAAIAGVANIAMPQVYWEQSHNPAQQLERTVKEYNNPALVGFPRPVIPTGAV